MNKQLNIVIGNVFINNFLNERLSLYFSCIRCLIECKKQKYIKKDTNGLKYIKQNKSNVISIIRFTDIFLSITLIRKNKDIKIIKYKKNSLQLNNKEIKFSLTKKNIKISFIS